ncbi:MAG: hypothetical protein K0M58_09955 [Thiobacillus sp.]|nr:hypothetical protein [Thiobacillus sp.]
MRVNQVLPKFVEFIPDHLEDGVLYISERFRTCSHKCCCGCGEEVVTPLSPAEWRLTREGELVSLWPSVGNWDYACRSHYVIRRNQVRWAGAMNIKQIARVQRRDAADLADMMSLRNAAMAPREVSPTQRPVPPRPVTSAIERKAGSDGKRPGILEWLKHLLFGD